jgi:hypothetical protein
MRGVRCHYCAYCKQTLVRPCAKAKCKREAGGDYVDGKTRRPKKRVKRVHPTNSKDAIDPDDADAVDNAPKISVPNASQPWLKVHRVYRVRANRKSNNILLEA